MTRKFSKKYLTEDLGLPHNIKLVMEDKIIEDDSYLEIHNIVFKAEDKYWYTEYRLDTSEDFDKEPWEHEDEIECEEVKKKLIQIEVWYPIDAE